MEIPKSVKKIIKEYQKYLPKKEKALYGLDCYSYSGVPKNEIWLLTNDKFYKITNS